jgi:hypothetical protein
MNLNGLKCRIQAGRNHVVVASAIILAGTLFSSATFALGTKEQRAACTSDVMRLCMSSLGSDSGIISCMKKNRSSLSARCKATLPPA